MSLSVLTLELLTRKERCHSNLQLFWGSASHTCDVCLGWGGGQRRCEKAEIQVLIMQVLEDTVKPKVKFKELGRDRPGILETEL
jgi:hypothetical protein